MKEVGQVLLVTHLVKEHQVIHQKEEGKVMQVVGQVLLVTHLVKAGQIMWVKEREIKIENNSILIKFELI
jgi:hypothetical protein